MLIEPQLENFFDPLEYIIQLHKYYNKLYFKGQLDSIPILWLRKTSSYKTRTLGQHDRNARIIQLSKHLLKNIPILKQILRHEMCHQAVFEIDNIQELHGKYWQAWARKCNIPENRLTEIDLQTKEEKEALTQLIQNSIPLINFSISTCCYYIEKGKKVYCRIYFEDENPDKVNIVQRGVKSFRRFVILKSELYQILDSDTENLLKKDIPDSLIDTWLDYMYRSVSGEYSKKEMSKFFLEVNYYQNKLIQTTKRILK